MMRGPILFHITLLFFFLLQLREVLPSCSTEKHLCHYHDALALLQFKGLFNANPSTLLSSYCSQYPHQKMTSWNAGKDCCGWDGVTCHQVTGRILGLDLSCSQLQGVIPPNSSLFRLSHLQQLNLAYNDLTGSRISHEFGTLRSLTQLNLSYSKFQGEVAAEISHLSNLISLDLSGNLVCSMGSCSLVRLEPFTFHKLLQNLTQLRVLSLSFVNISSGSSSAMMNLSSSLTYLDVGHTGLYGNLPSNVFHLPNMQVLLLSWNDYLSGSLPKFNCSILSPLEKLDVIETNFSGVLPDSIGCLNSLNSMQLVAGQFFGAIPKSIGNLTRLVRLNLENNYLNGQIPTSISNLQSVDSFRLGGNHLEGSLPDSFVNFTMLTDLDLSQNSLVGQFPISLLNLTYLSSLDVSNNHLKGQLGDFKSRSLEYIGLGNNQLSGSIPYSIFTLASLFLLDLSSNNFSGIELNMFQNNPHTSRAPLNTTNNSNLTNLGFLRLSSCEIKEFPDFLRNAGGLSYLDLSNNKIHGPIPSWFMSKTSKSLEYLNVSHNFLTGTIDQLPSENLDFLDMSSNSLQGQLPSSICNTSILEFLDLSNNNLTSTIPQCLGNSSNQLNLIDFRNNGFFGTIPATLFSGNSLQFLIVNDNQLEGPLPRSLANCTSLQILDLGNNKIDDKFPMWLETLTELLVLILKSNRFQGSIGNCKSKSPFPQLRIIDVSHNELSGVLPPELIKNFKAMRSPRDLQTKPQYMRAFDYYHDSYYIRSVSLVMKGVEYSFEKVLKTRMAIDFSSNRFEGEIPKVIGNLHSLQILNLSHNNLSGHIPRSFGNLNMLESLDLSWNQLEGTIPEELLNLTFLGFLNLSENHLVGRIPRGRHLDTFENDSYRGNLALCGTPLTKDCSDIGAPPPSTPLGFDQDNDSKFFDGFTWKAVLLGYGFGLVLGLAMGCLMFSIGKPRWFINFVEEAYKLQKRPRKWIHMRA